MKLKWILFFVLLFNSFLVLAEVVDPMTITIEATSLTTDSLAVRNFAVGTQMFTNRINMPIENIPVGFENYKFLSIGGNSSQSTVEGKIIPSVSGYIYVAIRAAVSTSNTILVNAGWVKTSYTFTYGGGSLLTIYEKAVVAGDEIDIPQITDFRGAIPIAKNIIYQKDKVSYGDADEMTINITTTRMDSMEIRSFQNETSLLINENVPLKNVPERFQNYKFLSHYRYMNKISMGTITAQNEGKIYLIGRRTVSPGANWVAVDTFSYASTYSPLVIYEKTVTSGEVVDIPLTTDLRGFCPIAKKILINGKDPDAFDEMSVTIETPSYFEKKTFSDGALYLLDRTYTLYSTPAGLNGYEFLSSSSGVSDDNRTHDGTIIPSADGYVYVIGRALVDIPDWTRMDGMNFYYNAGTPGELAVFKKKVTAGERVAIPKVDNFQEIKPIAKTITLVEAAYPTPIIFEITQTEQAAFTARTFSDNAQFYSDENFTISNSPVAFSGFKYLANKYESREQGTIIPEEDGVVYVIAKSGGLYGWTWCDRFDFTVNGETLSVYEKEVTAGERIELPLVNNEQGVTPIAKTITISIISPDKEARLENITIDGKELYGFSREKQTYTVYLPYTYNELAKPLVRGTAMQASATVVQGNIETVIGTEDERTATMIVTSADGTVQKEYKVMFIRLPKLDLYLCIGSSNMVGKADIDNLSGDYNVINNAYILNPDMAFEQAVNPFNKYSNVNDGSNMFGFQMSFAQSIINRTDTPLGFVVNAKDASTIENWTKGGTGQLADSLYAATLDRIVAAKNWGDFKAILWQQGEENKTDISNYENRLKQLITDLRTDLNNDTVLFVAGQLGAFGANVENFNTLIQSISTFKEHTACVSSADISNLSSGSDFFDRAGYITLGQRYAQIIADSIYKPAETKVKIEADVNLFSKRTLAKGVDFYINQTSANYQLTDEAFSGFDGFEFLSSAYQTTESAVITPESAGYIYLVAKKGLTLNGWTAVFGTDIHYVNTEMCIYKRSVTAGERIALPVTSDARGVTPIAKSIDFVEIYPEKDTRLDSLIVENSPLSGFSKDVLQYSYLLPYTTTVAPQIRTVTHVNGADAQVIDASNIRGNAEAERTSLIRVVSQDGSKEVIYRVTFEVLPELDLFLCIGQSNMAGAAKPEADKGDLDNMTNTYLLNKEKRFEVARNGLNRYCNIATTFTQYFGPMYPFAKKIVSATNRNIGLIVNARGGSPIELWEKTGTDAGDSLYAKTMERALEAQKWGTYKAILWHQGEGNRYNYTTVPYNKTGESINYITALQYFVNDLRTDLGNENLLFVAGEVNYWNPDLVGINSVLVTVPDNIANSGCASAQGLINITNLTDMDGHFNRESLIILGERYADIVLDKAYNNIATSNNTSTTNSSFKIQTNGLNLSVESNAKENVFCKIQDMLGKTIFNTSIDRSKTVTLPSKGIYVVNLIANDLTYSRKILIK